MGDFSLRTQIQCHFNSKGDSLIRKLDFLQWLPCCHCNIFGIIYNHSENWEQVLYRKNVLKVKWINYTLVSYDNRSCEFIQQIIVCIYVTITTISPCIYIIPLVLDPKDLFFLAFAERIITDYVTNTFQKLYKWV